MRLLFDAMLTRSKDLHGSAPDTAGAALVLIDMINDLDFPGHEGLLRAALPMARRVRNLKRRAQAAGLPIIYVNDNFGRWQSNFNRLVEHCLHDEVPGRAVVELLRPGARDYFVLKPKHSGFYSTTLAVLLDHLGVHTLILTGMAGNICVLFTANDAYMRDFKLFVPSDCVASNTKVVNDHALAQMRQVLKARTGVARGLDLRTINRPGRSRPAASTRP